MRFVKRGLLCLLVAIMLCGCTRGSQTVSKAKENYDYPRAQAMIVVATERNRYEQVYTSAIWDVVLENGKTFEAYLLEQIQGFLKDLKTMNLLAESQAVTISIAEKDRLRQVAERYYNGLSQEDIQYMGVTLEDVQALYEEYFTANKLVGELTKEMDLEVSDSEAKVISVRQIVLDDREEANEAYAKVMEEGSDFIAIAEDVTEDQQIEVQMMRGEASEALEEAAFGLVAGEISPLVESDGFYYIFQCVNDYDVEATKERKAQLYEERKTQAFQQIYAQFQTEHEVVFTDELWSQIHFGTDDQTTADNFFELYQEEFGSQGY